VTLYVLLRRASAFKRLALTGALGFGLFVAYAQALYGTWLPTFYRTLQAPRSETYLERVLGNLISPSRGLLVFVPGLVLVTYLLLRYRAFVVQRALCVAALAAAAGTFLLMSAWPIWWGGHSYGPRLSTTVVPWLYLLAVLALRSRLDAQAAGVAGRGTARIEAGCGCLLVAAGLALNGAGALSVNTWLWNVSPSGIDENPQRLWDWRRAQFLAAVSWPFLEDAPFLPPSGRLLVEKAQAKGFLVRGWSRPQGAYCWTSTRRAEIDFSREPPTGSILRMRLRPHLVPGRLERQRLTVILNGRRLGSWMLDRSAPAVLSSPIPAGTLRPHNRLELELPDAEAPAALGANGDQRQLGVALWWLEVL
jgi:hypothetical protein